MNFLEEKILSDGVIKDGDILKVDSFMFGSIMFAGFGMLAKCGSSQRNMIITSLSLSVGLGFTQASSMFTIFPQIVQTIFAENCVAIVFLLAVILNLLLPRETKEEV